MNVHAYPRPPSRRTRSRNALFVCMTNRGRGGAGMTCPEIFGRRAQEGGRTATPGYILRYPLGHHHPGRPAVYQEHPTPSGATMKLARLFLAVLTISTLAACSDSVTGPRAEPAAKPSADGSCTLERQ